MTDWKLHISDWLEQNTVCGPSPETDLAGRHSSLWYSEEEPNLFSSILPVPDPPVGTRERLERLRRFTAKRFPALWKPSMRRMPREILELIHSRVPRHGLTDLTSGDRTKKKKITWASRNRKPLSSLESLRQMQSRSSPSATNVNAAEDSSYRMNDHEKSDDVDDGADDDDKCTDLNDDKDTSKPFKQERPKIEPTSTDKFSARTNKRMRERRKDFIKHYVSDALHSHHVALPHTYAQNPSEEEKICRDSSSMDEPALRDSEFFDVNTENDLQLDDPDTRNDDQTVDANDESGDHLQDSDPPSQDGDGASPSTRKDKRLVKAFRKRFPFLPPHVLQKLCNLSSAPRLYTNPPPSQALEPLSIESNSELYVPEFNPDDLWCPLSEDLPPPITMDSSEPYVPPLIDSIMGNSITSSHGGTTNVSVDSGNSYGNVTMNVHNHFNNFCTPPLSWFHSLYFHLMHPLVCIVPAFCTFLPLFQLMWVYP